MNIFRYIKIYTELFVFKILKTVLSKIQSDYNSILFINTGEMGDLIVSSLLLENPSIFKEYSHVGFVIKEQYLELFSNYKGPVEFIGYNYKKYKFSIRYKYKFLTNLRLKKFKKCIHLTAARGILNEEMTHLCGAEEIITINTFTKYLDKSVGKYFNKKYTVILASDILNEYEKHYELLRFLSQNNIKAVFNQGITFNQTEISSNKFTDVKNAIVISPFSSARNRDWDIDYFVQLVKKLSVTHNIVLIGSSDQNKDLLYIQNQNNSVKVLAGILKLYELPSLLKRAELFIGLDSGVTHIALKVGTPLIAIIGGGEFGRFFPYRESDKTRFLYSRMDCFSCHWECVREDLDCLNRVTPYKVISEVKKLLPL